MVILRREQGDSELSMQENTETHTQSSIVKKEQQLAFRLDDTFIYRSASDILGNSNWNEFNFFW